MSTPRSPRAALSSNLPCFIQIFLLIILVGTLFNLIFQGTHHIFADNKEPQIIIKTPKIVTLHFNGSKSNKTVNTLNFNAIETHKTRVQFSSDFEALFTSEDRVIHGNPLTYPECYNAIINTQTLSKTELSSKYLDSNVNYNGLFPPKFWSREEYAAVLDPTHEIYIHTSVRATWDVFDETRNPEKYKNKNISKTAYIQIGKCGSSSTIHYIRHLSTKYNISFHQIPRSKLHRGASFKDKKNNGYQNGELVFNSTCSFMFVRDPIHRLVSAYYTINFWLWKNMMRYDEGNIRASEHYLDIMSKWAFWNTTGEPLRFYKFCYDMIDYPNQFTIWHPLEHIISQTGNISPWFGSELHFIGRVEYYDKHWELLSKYKHCSNDIKYDTSNGDYIWHDMHGEGTKPDNPRFPLAEGYVKALSLAEYNVSTMNKYSLPAWKAIRNNQSFFNDLVEYYYQDYICWGYKPVYKKLGIKYTGKLHFPNTALEL